MNIYLTDVKVVFISNLASAFFIVMLFIIKIGGTSDEYRYSKMV